MPKAPVTSEELPEDTAIVISLLFIPVYKHQVVPVSQRSAPAAMPQAPRRSATAGVATAIAPGVSAAFGHHSRNSSTASFGHVSKHNVHGVGKKKVDITRPSAGLKNPNKANRHPSQEKTTTIQTHSRQASASSNIKDKSPKGKERDDDDEWVSSSGAETPCSNHTANDSDQDDQRAADIQQRLEKAVAATPRAQPPFLPQAADPEPPTPTRLQRVDTQSTLILSPEETGFKAKPISPTPPLPAISHAHLPTPPASSNSHPSDPRKESGNELQNHVEKQNGKRHDSPSPARSQPPPLSRSQTYSPMHVEPPPERRSKTRPPSIRSLTSQHGARPHPLIRGLSFNASESSHHEEDHGMKAPATASLQVDSPTSEDSFDMGDGKHLRFSLNPTTDQRPKHSSNPPPPPAQATGSRIRTTSLTPSLTALSSLSMTNIAPAGQRTQSAHASNRTSWHFPSLQLPLPHLMAPSATPAPSRPATPPPLIGMLPEVKNAEAEIGEESDSEGADENEEDKAEDDGMRYWRRWKRRQVEGEWVPGEEETLGMGEWIPAPYFEEHLTARRYYGDVWRRSWQRCVGVGAGRD